MPWRNCGRMINWGQNLINYVLTPIKSLPAKIPSRLSIRAAMSIFQRPAYKSEVTQFIEQMKSSKPELEKTQRDGRALLWDKSINREVAQDIAAGRVAQKPYVYQTNA